VRSTDTREAFDRHAADYDQRFSRQPIGAAVRREVWARADSAFRNASRLLDLGCGTGEDAIHFAEQGIHVTAVDSSSGMLKQLQAKLRMMQLADRVECVGVEMSSYTAAPDHFDGVISNFGALNCLPDLCWLGRMARQTLRPQSRLVLTTLGRLYPLETLVFLYHGQPGKAFRRFGHSSTAMVEGVPVEVYYHSAGAIGEMLGPEFRLESLTGLCSLRPAPGMEHLGNSRLIRSLAPLDRALCRWRPTASLAGHFVSVWRYAGE
jgi:ubiquinone/menaquinone biosynthesis C-methylase UbiE